MGTFHAKYLIVDRKVACLNSNNIQVCYFRAEYETQSDYN